MPRYQLVSKSGTHAYFTGSAARARRLAQNMATHLREEVTARVLRPVRPTGSAPKRRRAARKPKATRKPPARAKARVTRAAAPRHRTVKRRRRRTARTERRKRA